MPVIRMTAEQVDTLVKRAIRSRTMQSPADALTMGPPVKPEKEGIVSRCRQTCCVARMTAA